MAEHSQSVAEWVKSPLWHAIGRADGAQWWGCGPPDSWSIFVSGTSGKGKSEIQKLLAVLVVAMSLLLLATSPVAAAAPDAPAAPNATVVSATSVDLAWNIPATNGTPLASFTITAIPADIAPITGIGPTVTTSTVPGLTAGTAYTFTVTAIDTLAEEATSPPSNSVTPNAVPGIPAAPSAAASGADVTVSWDPPVNTGSAITGYTVTASPGGATFPSAGAATSLVASGLTAGTAYTFTVVATNAAGSSGSSPASNSATPSAVPDIMVAPTAVVATSTSVTVNWTVPNDNGSAITLFRVAASTGGTQSIAGPTATSLVYSGLAPGVPVTFTVTASNANGENTPSQPSNSVTPPGAPDNPGAPTVSVVSATSVDVSWTEPADNGSAITGYTVTASPGGATFPSAGAATSLVASGLTAGTAYTFTVVATNAAGSSGSSPASNSATPVAAPGAPGKPDVLINNSTSIELSWAAAAPNGSAISDYEITATPGGTALNTGGPDTSFIFTGLTTGTSYTFVVRAINAQGTSAASTASNAITPAGTPGTPGIPTVAVAGSTAINLTWAPATDNGAAVTYTVTATPGGATRNTTATSLTFNGLTTGTSYAFTVKAANAIGDGGTSGASNAIVPAGVPDQPAAPDVLFSIPVGLDKLTVSWTTPGANGSPITGYTLRATPQGGSPFTIEAASSPAIVTGLETGTSYTFEVRANNAFGGSAYSGMSGSVLVPAAPDEVTNIQAVNRTPFGNVVVVSWDPPENNGGSEVLSYTVRMAGVEGTVDVGVSSVAIGPLPVGFHSAEIFANTAIGSGAPLSSNQIEVRAFAPFRSEDAFVAQQYRDFLGREADAGGLAFWATQTNDDKSNVAEVIVRFMRSPEFAPRRAVARMYLAYFDRNPEAEGYDFWSQRLANNQATIESVSQFFATGQEFQATYGKLSNAEFVDLVYQNVLKRPGDAGGVAFWLGRLNAGLDRGTMMTQFSESPENQVATSAKVDVIVTYRGLLDREPDGPGEAFWIGQIGNDPSAIFGLVANFYVSPEYGNRVVAG